jgi:hypothetical protein
LNHFFVKVRAFWRWLRYVEAKAAKRPLLINLDETSLTTFFEGGRGTVVGEKTPAAVAKSLGPKVSKASLRGTISHVALICNDPGLQPLLPKFIIGNKRKFTRSLLEAVEGDRPQAVQLLAEKTAWNKNSVMTRLLPALAKVLEDKHAQPILLFDCAPCHLGAAVYSAARAANVDLVYVPAGMTAFLQPLDVAVFVQFKGWLRKEWRSLQSASPEGRVPDAAWLKLCMKAASTFLRSRRWGSSFKAVGAGGQDQLGSAIVRDVPGALASPIPEGPPSPADLEATFPRRRCPQVPEVIRVSATKRRLVCKTAVL